MNCKSCRTECVNLRHAVQSPITSLAWPRRQVGLCADDRTVARFAESPTQVIRVSDRPFGGQRHGRHADTNLTVVHAGVAATAYLTRELYGGFAWIGRTSAG